MLWLCVTPERELKTRRIMYAMLRGIGTRHARLVVGEPPDDHHPFMVWGQEWLALRLLPKAAKAGRPFWHIDNGFWRPARGTSVGYYRITYRSLSPILLRAAPRERAQRMNAKLRPWRANGEHVVLAYPGASFGRALGLDMEPWKATIFDRIREHTKRGVLIRPKGGDRALAADLARAWALVTHSSNVAVDAVLAGIPVFVAPTSPAAPVGRTDLEIEQPVTPDRTTWWASLMCQQFSLDEMARGVPRGFMQAISKQVDGDLTQPMIGG